MKYLYDCQLNSPQHAYGLIPAKEHHLHHFLQLIKKKKQLAAWHFGKYEQGNDLFI